jgi:AcrR family transcriptional regulator
VNELLNIERAAAKVAASRTALEDAIRAAHAYGGISLRVIAEAAGVSHETVRRIVSG